MKRNASRQLLFGKAQLIEMNAVRIAMKKRRKLIAWGNMARCEAGMAVSSVPRWRDCNFPSGAHELSARMASLACEHALESVVRVEGLVPGLSLLFLGIGQGPHEHVECCVSLRIVPVSVTLG